MPMERTHMRKIREVLRLKFDLKLGERQIVTSCRVSKTTINRYVRRFKKLGLPWPLPPDIDDAILEQLLFPYELKFKRNLPNWHYVHQELKRKSMTKWLIWEEYKETEPNGISYSRFCRLYREFLKTLNPVMRQTHKAGEKMFIDYAGQTIPWTDRLTGEVYQAEMFLAVLGASNYTFAEATRSQKMPDWIGSHVRAFQFFGGVSEMLIPDNLKSGVTSAHYYDPEINQTYQDMANHYNVAVVPARSRAPKDKAKVEAGVLHIERYILARLRNHTFFSIAEINEAIKKLLIEFNKKPFQKLPGSRLSQFIELDKPTLKPLPKHQYEYAEWKKARVGIDYHVAFEKHYYSVPHKYVKQQFDLRITRTMIECFYKNKSIAVHRRSYKAGHTTIKEHMPKSHREQAEWTPDRLKRWAKKEGNDTEKLIKKMIESRPQPQQAFRACLGVMRLGRTYGNDRLENASKRALAIGSYSYKSIASILKHGLDKKPIPGSVETKGNGATSKIHHNIRGPDYYK